MSTFPPPDPGDQQPGDQQPSPQQAGPQQPSPQLSGDQPPPADRPARPWSGRRLVRRRDDRMVAGVCSGVADYLGVDVTVVRLLTVLATIFGLGSVLIAYLIAWALLPEE